MISHIACTDMVSPQCELTYAGQDYYSVKKFSHTWYIDVVSPQYESSYQGRNKGGILGTCPPLLFDRGGQSIKLSPQLLKIDFFYRTLIF